MKRTMRTTMKATVRFLLMALMCCLFTMTASAKPAKTTVLKAYAKFVKTQYCNGTKARYCVIDIDGDGVKELILFRGVSGSSGARADFYMYRNGKVVKMSVDKVVTGCGSVFRVYGTKNFCISKSSGKSKFFFIYKKTGSSIRMVAKYSQEYNSRTRKYIYKLNGRKISYLKYKSYCLRLSVLKFIR